MLMQTDECYEGRGIDIPDENPIPDFTYTLREDSVFHVFSIESLATWTDQYCGTERTASFFQSDYTAFPDSLMDIY